MKLSGRYMVHVIASDKVLIPAEQKVLNLNSIIKLNDTGGFIIECLQNNISYDGLLKRLTEKYRPENESEARSLKEDLDVFLKQLEEKGMLEQE